MATKPSKTKKVSWPTIINWTLIIGQLVLIYFQVRDRVDPSKSPEGTTSVMPDFDKTARNIYNQLPEDIRMKVDHIRTKFKEDLNIEISLSQIIDSMMKSGEIQIEANQ